MKRIGLSLTKRQWMAIIFILAIGARLALALVTYSPRYAYTGEAEWIAKSVALGHGFSGAYAIPTGPTAHCGPFYVTLTALIYSVLGAGGTAEWVRIGLLILVNALACALLPAVALALDLPLACGIGAGLAAAIIPMHRTAEIFHAWDEPYAAFGLMAALTLLYRWQWFRGQPLRSGLLYGILWGILLHISPAMLLVLAGLSALGLWIGRHEMPGAIRSWVAVWLAAVVVLIPWTLRNRVQLGGWIFMRSNLGIELDMSNSDRSGPTSDDNTKAGLYRDTHPSINVREAQSVRDMGEIRYSRNRQARALDWIRRHPGRFMELTLARVRLFWLGAWRDPETAWLFALATLLAAIGAWFLWRDGRRQVLWMFAVVWACYPITYYVVQHLPRYRVPIWWTVLLAAAYGVRSLVARRIPSPTYDPVTAQSVR
jgi:hypothetical protein